MPESGYTKRRHVWTQEAVVEKIREWVELHGEPPVASEWNPTDCMRAAHTSADRARAWAERAERFYDGEWPWTGSVFKLFGGWNNALRAAAVPVSWQGRRRVKLNDPTNLDTDDLRRRVDEVETAMVSGNRDALRRALCQLADDALGWARDVPETKTADNWQEQAA